ncbi:prepilin peptidase [Clostridiaceae bacterium 35-E11]
MSVFVVTLGLMIGSFLNVCIYRIPRKISILYPGSHCPRCKTRLKPRDLIPMLSYILTKAKCRYCGEGISPRYPLVELMNGLIYLLLYHYFGFTLTFLQYAVLSSLLLVIAWIDYDLQIIPDELMLFGLLVGTMLYVFRHDGMLWRNGLIGLLIGGGIFLLIAVVSKGAMGGGDIKLMGVLGYWLGGQYILLITLLSFVIGAVFSILLLLLKIKGRKDMIPFGPFIAMAAFITIIYGESIIYWYLLKFL